MPKSTKRFRLTNSGLNAHGFRMLTAGGVLDEFKANPIMLFNHIRPKGNKKNQILPIGIWTDIEQEGDDIFAVPVFDDKDAFAMSIYDKVENGFIKMCSIGAEPLETSDDPDLLLPGQESKTVTKWLMKECSICDMGANPDAITVALYDRNNRLINLSNDAEALIPKLNKMSKPVKADPKKSVKLADDTSAADPNKPKDDNEPKAQLSDDDDSSQETPEETIARLSQENEDLKTRLSEMEKQLKLAAETDEDKQVAELADKAVRLRKITLAQKPMIVKMAKSDWNATVEYLNSIKSSPTAKEVVTNNHEKSASEDRIKTLSAKSFDDLFKSGELAELKLAAPDVYVHKYKSKFGKEPSKN